MLDREWTSDLCNDRTQLLCHCRFSCSFEGEDHILFDLLIRSSGMSISFDDLVQRGWHDVDVCWALSKLIYNCSQGEKRSSCY